MISMARKIMYEMALNDNVDVECVESAYDVQWNGERKTHSARFNFFFIVTASLLLTRLSSYFILHFPKFHLHSLSYLYSFTRLLYNL